VTLNLYVMPIVAGAKPNTREPKYRSSYASVPNPDMLDYGNESWCLVGLTDPPASVDTALKANADVIAIPTNLDQAVGAGALARVRSDLESVNIPGTWVQATNTWRDVVRYVYACCRFAQRFQGGNCGGQWFTGGTTLATTFGALTAAVRQCVLDAASSFSFDTSALTAGSTLRQVLVSVGNQYLGTQPQPVFAGVLL
jgi:hypothetical protein